MGWSLPSLATVERIVAEGVVRDVSFINNRLVWDPVSEDGSHDEGFLSLISKLELDPFMGEVGEQNKQYQSS